MKTRLIRVVAFAGEPLAETQLRRILPATGELATLDTRPFERDGLFVLALTAAGRPIGLLVLTGQAAARHEREPLLLFANHIALAVERVQLRDQPTLASGTMTVTSDGTYTTPSTSLGAPGSLDTPSARAGPWSGSRGSSVAGHGVPRQAR